MNDERERLLTKPETETEFTTRAGGGEYPVPTVDLTPVAAEMLSQIGSDDVAANTEFPSTVTLWTAAETLRAIPASPLENAVTYAESSVAVPITPAVYGYRIALSDDGSGIPVAKLQTLLPGPSPRSNTDADSGSSGGC
jgi:hypothetical protein